MLIVSSFVEEPPKFHVSVNIRVNHRTRTELKISHNFSAKLVHADVERIKL